MRIRKHQCMDANANYGKAIVKCRRQEVWVTAGGEGVGERRLVLQVG